MGQYFNFNLAAMDVSVDFVVRMGPELVSAHNRKLIELMFERLPKDRFVPASPLDPARRGPYGCFAARSKEKTAEVYSICGRKMLSSACAKATFAFRRICITRSAHRPAHQRGYSVSQDESWPKLRSLALER